MTNRVPGSVVVDDDTASLATTGVRILAPAFGARQWLREFAVSSLDYGAGVVAQGGAGLLA